MLLSSRHADTFINDRPTARLPATVQAKQAGVAITVTLPDGAKKPGVKNVTTPLEIALGISKGLADKVNEAQGVPAFAPDSRRVACNAFCSRREALSLRQISPFVPALACLLTTSARTQVVVAKVNDAVWYAPATLISITWRAYPWMCEAPGQQDAHRSLPLHRRDVFRPLEGDCTLELCTFDHADGRDVRIPPSWRLSTRELSHQSLCKPPLLPGALDFFSFAWEECLCGFVCT